MQSLSSSQRALVTGASEGIGRAFALQLAQAGYSVTVVARTETRLDSLLTELPKGNHRKLVADLATPGGVSAVVRELTASEPYSLLVNNAGFGLVGDFTDGSLERIREMIALNISALVELSYAYLGRARRGDGIIQVSSTLSFLPMPNQTVYSATKAFVTSFSESLWYQARKRGVHVLNLCPGSTATLFPTRSGGTTEKIPKWVTESPEQVAAYALRTYARRCGPTIVSGLINRIFLVLLALVPRRQRMLIMGRVQQ